MKKSDVPKQLSISSSPVRGKTGLMLRGLGFRRKAIKVLHPPRLKVIRGKGKRKRVGHGFGALATVGIPLLLHLLSRRT